MAAERIDVLAVMDDRANAIASKWPEAYADGLREARAAVAELIEEVRELLASHPVARTYPDGPCIERQQRAALTAALTRMGEGA